MYVDGRVKRLRPGDHASVEVRVRDGDGLHAAPPADLLDSLRRENIYAVPEHIASACNGAAAALTGSTAICCSLHHSVIFLPVSAVSVLLKLTGDC